MKKVMLLAAMLAMVLAAAVPALAQSVTQVGEDNIACVQTAVQQEVNKTQINQYGDNINIQNISQECNINVTEVETILNEIGVTEVATASASAAATAGASATSVQYSASSVQYQYSAPSVQYQYSAPSVQYQCSAAAELPSTGGSSLIALGVGVLLVAGGLLARRIVR